MKTFNQLKEVIENPSRNLKKQAKAAAKRVDVDFDGDVDKNDTTYGGDYGEFVPSADGKKKLRTGKVKFATEATDLEQRAKDMAADRKAQMAAHQAAIEKDKTNKQQARDIGVDLTRRTLEKVKDAIENSRKKKKDLLDTIDDEMNEEAGRAAQEARLKKKPKRPTFKKPTPVAKKPKPSKMEKSIKKNLTKAAKAIVPKPKKPKFKDIFRNKKK